MGDLAGRVDRLEHDVQQLRFARKNQQAEIGATSAAVDLTYAAVQALDVRVEGFQDEVRVGFTGVEARLEGIEGVLAEILRRLPGVAGE